MKRCIYVLISFVILFGVAVVVNKVRLRYDWETAYWRTLMTPLTGTVWSKDFTEEAFAQIKLGMSSSEVKALLGEPLRRDCDEEGCFWPYTGQDTDTADSDRRWVTFDVKDRVIKIRHEFHID